MNVDRPDRRGLALLGALSVVAAGVLTIAALRASSDDGQLTLTAPASTSRDTVPDASPDAPTSAPPAPSAGTPGCRLGEPGSPCGSAPLQVRQALGDPDLPGCPADAARAAVVDKAAQRFWLCADGLPSTEALRMTSASAEYGLPPVGTHDVFAKDAVAWGLHGERLNRFVAFYTTSRGNRIAFHEYVNQAEDTIGDLDQRGDSSGCLRVSTDDSWLVWDFLEIGDPVVVITN